LKQNSKKEELAQSKTEVILRTTEILTVFLSANSVIPRGKKNYPEDCEYLHSWNAKEVTL